MGAEFLAFGLSPFIGVAEHDGDLPWLRSLQQFASKIDLESVYPIQALAKKKLHHCAGQAVPLHERFVSADPAFALLDTVRFMSIIFGDIQHKLPETFACFLKASSADALAAAFRLVHSATALARAWAERVLPSPRLLLARRPACAS